MVLKVDLPGRRALNWQIAIGTSPTLKQIKLKSRLSSGPTAQALGMGAVVTCGAPRQIDLKISFG